MSAKFEDSNIANLSGAANHEAKYVAAQHEEAWKAAGKEPGVQIWRVEKFHIKAWPKDQYGQFYSGDAYIVLHTFKDPASKNDKLNYHIHFWLGTSSSQDEQGTAAYKTVELDDYFHNSPTEYRECQSYESPQFRSLFPTLTYLEGGIDSGFNHVHPHLYKPRLLQLDLLGKHQVRVTQVPLTVSSLSDADVYVLDGGLQLWQFNTPGSNPDERRKATEIIAGLKESRHSKPIVTIIDGLKEKDDGEFWKALGGGTKPTSLSPSKPDAAIVEVDKKLFQLIDDSGKLSLTPVSSGSAVQRSQLQSNSVYILDLNYTVYAWIGKSSSAGSKKAALKYAVHYLEEHKRPLQTPCLRVQEGADFEEFEHSFTHAGSTHHPVDQKVIRAA